MFKGKSVTAIILVAGSSTRFGTGCNKNLELINNKSVIEYSIEAFNNNSYIDKIIIAYRIEDLLIIKDIVSTKYCTDNICLVEGGKTRKESVYNCLKEINSDIVIIHDGARPAIKQEYINKCIESMEHYKGVTIGVPSKDTIKITNNDGIVVNSTDRSNTWIIQTPQCFDKKVLLDQYNNLKNIDVTDDCMILEKAGYEVKVLEGDYTNLKITTYEDLDIMRLILN